MSASVCLCVILKAEELEWPIPSQKTKQQLFANCAETEMSYAPFLTNEQSRVTD